MKMLPLLLLLALFSLSAFSQTIEYDEFRDETIIRSDAVNMRPGVRYRPRMGINLHAAIYHKGKTLPADPEYYFTITSRTSDWTFMRSNGLIFLADGERIMMGDAKRTGNVYRGYVAELLIYATDVETMRRLADAKEVRAQFGIFESTLGPEFGRAVKQVVDHVGGER